MNLPDKKYSIIYADPPWKYKAMRDKYVDNNSANASTHYPTLSFEEIKNIDVKKIVAEDCMLFLWITFPHLQEGLYLIKAWGFKYKTVAFSWVKTVKDGSKPSFGVGHYTRSNVEICLLGVKGKALKESSSVSSVIISPREKHSKKPDMVRDKIIELCGNRSRIELFARQKAEGWDSWGDEIK